ncbi:MAG: RNA-guided endonuclease InsQ/TnpB family protein, partial [Brevundimonas sp.]
AVLYGYGVFKTFSFRLKDGSSSTRRALRQQARAVNYLWNYCCQVDREAHARWKAGVNTRRPTAFELTGLCRGVTRELGIHSDTVDAVCKRFADARRATFPQTPRFRTAKRNLDWIPFSNFDRPANLTGSTLTVLKRGYRLWMSRPIPEGCRRGTWSFSADARGRWYVSIQVEMPDVEARPIVSEVGIDLGLKTLATLSNGEKIETPAFYRKAEARLAVLQRRGQKVRARSLAAKVRNQRKHFLHVASANIVKRHDRIVIGDVSPSRLAKTRMAKSIHDASWAALRTMLQYKSIATGATCEIVSERYTSQVCSSCGCISASSPKGMGALGIRQWVCSDCGVSHDRDVNAAINILKAGAECRPLAEEITRHLAA